MQGLGYLKQCFDRWIGAPAFNALQGVFLHTGSYCQIKLGHFPFVTMFSYLFANIFYEFRIGQILHYPCNSLEKGKLEVLKAK